METELVGRKQELARLQEALGEADAGRGRVVMVAGEPGIGKTALSRAFARFAGGEGAVVLSGDIFEGSWQPAFGPWTQALGSYVRGADPDELRRHLGSAAAVLTELVEDLRVVLPGTPDPPRLGPEQERVRLYDRVARFLAAIAEERPVVVFLDDLHWADVDSLHLLRYVCRNSRDAADPRRGDVSPVI